MCFIGYVICEAPPSFARKCRCMVATQWFPPAIELLLFFSFFLILCFTIFTCWTKMTLPSTVPRRRVPHTTNDCVQLRTVCRLIKTWQLLCTIEGGAWLCRKHRMVICFFFSSSDFLLITFVPANWAHRNASRSGLAGGTVFTSIWRQFTIIFLLSAYEYHMLFTPWVSFNV